MPWWSELGRRPATCMTRTRSTSRRPNVDAGGLTFGTRVPENASEAIRGCLQCREACLRSPCFVKLTAERDRDHRHREVAHEASGADAISLGQHAAGHGDRRPTRRKPVLGSRGGRPFRPRCEARCAAHGVAVPSARLKVPILGMGGVSTGNRRGGIHARRRYRRGGGHGELHESACGTIEVVAGIEAYCEEQGVADVNDLIGGLQC